MPGLATSQGALLKRLAPIAIELAVNVAAPLLIYDLTVSRLGEVGALLASSAAPMLWTLVEFARHRRVDAISMLVLLGLCLSLAMYLGGGGVHLLQLREKLVTGIIGAVFLVSAAAGRPLIYELYRASMKRDPERADALAQLESRADDPRLKAVFRTITLVWGFGLIAESALAVLLVTMLSVRDYLVIGPLAGYGVIGLLSLWTFLYVRQRQAIGRARRAAEAAAAEASHSDGA